MMKRRKTKHNEKRVNTEWFYSFQWGGIVLQSVIMNSSPYVLSLGPPCGLMNHFCFLLSTWAFESSKSSTHSLEMSSSKIAFSSSFPRGSMHVLSSQPAARLHASAFRSVQLLIGYWRQAEGSCWKCINWHQDRLHPSIKTDVNKKLLYCLCGLLILSSMAGCRQRGESGRERRKYRGAVTKFWKCSIFPGTKPKPH